MEDFPRLIYFPLGNDIGCREEEPIIFTVTEILMGGRFKGIAKQADAKKGRGPIYRFDKSIPYSDEAWTKCRQYLDRKRALKEEYKTLQKRLRKINPSTTHTQETLLPE